MFQLGALSRLPLKEQVKKLETASAHWVDTGTFGKKPPLQLPFPISVNESDTKNCLCWDCEALLSWFSGPGHVRPPSSET